jgi:hypothetical protein
LALFPVFFFDAFFAIDFFAPFTAFLAAFFSVCFGAFDDLLIDLTAQPNEEHHFSFCLHLGPRFTGRRADHQALGWRVEPRQRWTRCIARRDEGGHRNHEPWYHWREQQTLTRR